MIHRRNGRISFECDECGNTLEGSARDDWDEALATLRREGWVSKKEDEGWLHYCEECKP